MLFLKLQKDLNAARLARNGDKVKVLSTLIGELQRVLSKQLTDDDIIRTIRKFIEDSQTMTASTNEKVVAAAKYEISVLQAYLPSAMPKEDIEKFVIDFKTTNPDADIAKLMAALRQLKTDTGLAIDMGFASTVFKR
jgi:uncharacterized protein YqeY